MRNYYFLVNYLVVRICMYVYKKKTVALKCKVEIRFGLSPIHILCKKAERPCATPTNTNNNGLIQFNTSHPSHICRLEVSVSVPFIRPLV